MNKHQTAVAAEAFAAGVFAQAGLCVFVQYGANQPGYDLLVSDGPNRTLHVSVKGSTDGWWFLTAKDKNGTYQTALDQWVQRNASFVFCLVQFRGVPLGEIPRMYLATGQEIGEEFKTHWFGDLCLSLVEHYAPTRGKNKGKVQRIPPEWRLSAQRIREIMETNAEQAPSC